MAEILIIDNDPDFRRIVGQILSAAGHQISEAKAGIDGVAAFHARHPAMVISEIVISGNQGIETIRELRREARNLPILAVSGHIHTASISELRQFLVQMPHSAKNPLVPVNC